MKKESLRGVCFGERNPLHIIIGDKTQPKNMWLKTNCSSSDGGQLSQY